MLEDIGLGLTIRQQISQSLRPTEKYNEIHNSLAIFLYKLKKNQENLDIINNERIELEKTISEQKNDKISSLPTIYNDQLKKLSLIDSIQYSIHYECIIAELNSDIELKDIASFNNKIKHAIDNLLLCVYNINQITIVPMTHGY